MSPSATIMADKALLLDESDDYEVLLDFLEEEYDFPVLGGACCFTRRNINRVVDCFEAQSTPDNSNLQGKSKKIRVIRSSKKIAENKVKNSFYCTVNILITFNCRNVK